MEQLCLLMPETKEGNIPLRLGNKPEIFNQVAGKPTVNTGRDINDPSLNSGFFCRLDHLLQ